jgi:hypothetical protein
MLLLGTLLALLLLPPALAAGVPSEKASSGEASLAVQGDGQHYLGLIPSSPQDVASFPRIEVPASLMSNLSAAVDLSSQMPPVGNQGAQGSCVGWATSYYYKTWSEKQEHTGWALTNPWYQFSPSFVYNQINGGVDNGATFTDAFTLLQNKGDVDISEFPYNASDYKTKPTAAQLEAAKPYRIPSGWGYFWARTGSPPYLTANNISTIKAWLDSGKVLVMGIPIYSDFPDYGGNAPSKYYDRSLLTSLKGWHAVCIVGYDDNVNPSGSDADHKGGFKMVNSWGASWNGSNAGYLYLSYNFVKYYVREAWSMSDLSPDTPTITSLSATSGKVGDTIHILGKNFGTLRRNAKVTFNGVQATSVSFTDADITVQVPTGATTGPVKVYDWDGAESNAVNFTVEGSGPGPSPVTVTSITPNSAAQFGLLNSISDLHGSGFQEGATVRLETPLTTIYAFNVVVVSPNQITCDFFFFGQEPAVYDVIVQNPDGSEGRLDDAFTVTGLCGQGAGTAMVGFGITMGLLGLAGTGGLLGRRRKKRG